MDSKYKNTRALGRVGFDFFAVLPDTRVARIDPLISKGGVHKKNAA